MPILQQRHRGAHRLATVRQRRRHLAWCPGLPDRRIPPVSRWLQYPALMAAVVVVAVVLLTSAALGVALLFA